MWARFILRVSRHKKAAFVYMANEMIQRSYIKAQKKGAQNAFYQCFNPPVINEVLLKMLEIVNSSLYDEKGDEVRDAKNLAKEVR
jgi:hypothetical protein